MAAEEEAPFVAPVRELEEIDPGMLPQVDELRRKSFANSVRAIAAAAGSSPPAWSWSRAPRRCLLPKLASQQKIDVATLNVPAGPTEAEINAGEESRASSPRSTRSSPSAFWISTRARPRNGAARISPRPASRSTKSAACSNAGSTSRRWRPLAALDKALTEIEARVPAALAAQISEGKRALSAGEFENSRQAYQTALKIEPGNNEATDGLAKVAAASGVVPTLADAENAENAKDWPKAQTLFADVLKRNPGNVLATEGLARVRRTMADNEFNATMGAGLAALNAGRLSEARTHLEKARRMRPDSPEVAAALQRAADTGSGRSLAELEQRAARLAGEERWTEALAIYDEALARDPSLQFAIDGPCGRCAARGTRQAPADTHRQAGAAG